MCDTPLTCSISSLEKGAFTHMSTRVLSEKMIYGGRFSSLAILSCHGSLRELPESEIKQIINRLLEENILTVTQDRYALLRLTDLTEAVTGGVIFPQTVQTVSAASASAFPKVTQNIFPQTFRSRVR